jgi:putative DNA primase/helicase
MDDSYKRAGDAGDWQRTVAALCQDNSRLAFGVCAALAGALLQPTGAESGGFHFRGDSSKGKTTTLKVAASVWGAQLHADMAGHLQRHRGHGHAALRRRADPGRDWPGGRPRARGDGLHAGQRPEQERSTAKGFNRRRLSWRILWLSSGEKSMADHMAEAGKRAMAGQEVRMVDIPWMLALAWGH